MKEGEAAGSEASEVTGLAQIRRALLDHFQDSGFSSD